ncbi:MAG: DUF4350 domain-containing protein [Actinophytocola sp.]|nr:DUF4350 domain-containing protein [Actinophytocola sp.]
MTQVSPDARRVWLAARGPLAILLVIIAVAIVLTLLRGNSEGGRLDPRSADPNGSRALAQLLGDYGVDVEPVHTLAATTGAASDATVLVTHPNTLDPADLRQLGEKAAGLVLIAPNKKLARALDIDVTGHTADALHQPECALADTAGEATTGGVSYRAQDGERCYGASLVRVSHDSTPVTLLGTATPLTNDALDDAGNAALTMRLLGERERLVWYVPSPNDPALRDGTASLMSLLPRGWQYGIATLAIAAVLLALWRARRLGPVVTEPLPVVVHAAETTEGRARLYQRAGAADHAADALRGAARHRIATSAGLTADAGPDAVVMAASRAGRPPNEAHWLLYGPAPSDDAALVRLAAELDRLENEVRQACANHPEWTPAPRSSRCAPRSARRSSATTRR